MVFRHNISQPEAAEDEPEPPHSLGLDPKPVKRFVRGLFVLKDDAGIHTTRQDAIHAAIPYANHRCIVQVSRHADKWYVYLKGT
jgi:hypothetical protein